MRYTRRTLDRLGTAGVLSPQDSLLLQTPVDLARPMQSDSRGPSATCQEVVVKKPQPKKAATPAKKAKKSAPAPTTEAAPAKKAKKSVPRTKGAAKKA
jgi:hypothetical protein